MARILVIFVFGILLCVGSALVPVKIGSDVPPDWVDRVNAAQLLFSETDPSPDMMPFVGNGYLGTRILSSDLFVNGLYSRPDDDPKTVSHRSRIPNVLNFDVAGCSLVGTAVDVQYGVVYRRFDCKDIYTTVEMRWYADREQMESLILEIELVNSDEEENSVQLTSDAGPASADITFVETHNTTFDVYEGYTNVPEIEGGDKIYVCMVSSPFVKDLGCAGKSSTVYLFNAAVTTSLSASDNDLCLSSAAVWEKVQRNKDTNLDAQKRAWMDLTRSGMEVAGDLRLAQVINSSLYYIRSSIRDGWSYSLSPGGIASNSYNGHVFWDMECWMAPPLLLLNPELVKSGLDYRVKRIAAAQDKAKSYGERWTGAMFPWESALTGSETCPPSAPTGQLEQHISGDIVHLMVMYYYLVRDDAWMKGDGWSLLSEVAKWVASRVSLEGNEYIIDHVIPPDEYAVDVANSVYTNEICAMVLRYAIEMGKKFEFDVPSTYADIAGKLKIPFNESVQVHPEYDNYTGQEVKQADVILLGYPLEMPMSHSVFQNDLEFYAGVTDPNGPAMTWSMFCIGYLALSQKKTADDYFLRSYANAHAPFMVWTETPAGGAINFITGAGGFLQAVQNGYGGIRIHNDSLVFAPGVLPPSVSSLVMRQARIWDDMEIDINNGKEKTSIQLVVNPRDVSVEIVCVDDPVLHFELKTGSPFDLPKKCQQWKVQ